MFSLFSSRSPSLSTSLPSLFSLFSLLCLSLASDPQVSTEYGDIIGFSHQDIADVFLGIPFAKPPIGELRFKNPVPPDPWTLREAKNFSAGCIPHSEDSIVNPVSEDCLYLNIIVPKKKDNNELFPVLFYVHGGGFEIGSAFRYGYKSLAEIYAARGIIVVTIQYRLGVFGFFSLPDSSLKGNYGLFDQAEALHFIHRNIEKFGGDPSRITVFGVSAGGASAGMLTLSPLTRDIIAGSIEMSGSPVAAWSNDNRVEMHSEDLIRAAGCQGKRSMEDIEKCVRKLTCKQIHTAVDLIFEAAFSFNFLKFAPKIDGVFAPDRYENLIKSAPAIPVLTGIHSHEFAYFTQWNRAPTIHRAPILKHEQPKFNVDKFDMKARILLGEFLKEEEVEDAVRDVLSFYIGEGYEELEGKETPEDVKRLLEVYSHFWSDVSFNVPARLEVDARRQRGGETYVYMFEHYADGLFDDDEPVKGSFHVNEMSYVFDLHVLKEFEWTEKEKKIRGQVQDMMESFVKTGRPSINGIVWPNYSSSPSRPFIRIVSPQWKHAEHFVENATRFWEDVMTKYSFDFVRFNPHQPHNTQIPAPPTIDHSEL